MIRPYQQPMPFNRSAEVVCPTCGAHVHPPCRACHLAGLIAARRAAGVEGLASNSAGPARAEGDPTPDEITMAAAAIRRTWPAAERERRRVGNLGRVGWSLPFCEVTVGD